MLPLIILLSLFVGAYIYARRNQYHIDALDNIAEDDLIASLKELE